LLTGGGTAGHVNPNLALVPKLLEQGWAVDYIGSVGGIERQLVTQAGVSFYAISSGKLRRYFAWQNFIDPFKVIKGVADAYGLMRRLRPQVVFSKGGFVAVPVVWSAGLLKIPVVIHESDYTPGLANRLALPFANQICVTFPETLNYLGKRRSQARCTGLPIRQDLLAGDTARGRSFTNLTGNLPILLVMGGSSGAVAINRALRSILRELVKHFQVVHLCGKGNLEPTLAELDNYRQYEYLQAELADVLAMAELVVSRAGANAIFELLALRKPHLLIPLPSKSSRGDQILNAQSFAKQGYSLVLPEAELNDRSLLAGIQQLYEDRHRYVTAMKSSVTFASDTISQIIDILNGFCSNLK
jgi:UDP-N-acetylglucosamine--N-acetylmuramyl-(pentapeptide) pyrophosphoryl-undecaprenol N-acetylglucosamine transferase